MGRIYDTRAWRNLDRDGCVVHVLTDDPCEGAIARHHVHPMSHGGDEDGRTVPACAKHHPMLEVLARRVYGVPEWKRCPHAPGTHRYAGAREACEARLNRELTAA